MQLYTTRYTHLSIWPITVVLQHFSIMIHKIDAIVTCVKHSCGCSRFWSNFNKKCLQGNGLLRNTVIPTMKGNSTVKVSHDCHSLGKTKLLAQLWINCHLFRINSGKYVRVQVRGNAIIEIKISQLSFILFYEQSTNFNLFTINQ